MFLGALEVSELLLFWWSFPCVNRAGFRLVCGRKAQFGGCWWGFFTLSSSEPSNMVFMVGIMVSWVGREGVSCN